MKFELDSDSDELVISKPKETPLFENNLPKEPSNLPDFMKGEISSEEDDILKVTQKAPKESSKYQMKLELLSDPSSDSEPDQPESDQIPVPVLSNDFAG